jgi:hypothetical protein
MAPAVLRPSPFDSQLKKLGGSTPINVLTVCGDSLRRTSHAESARPDETDRALLALSVAEVAQGVRGIASGGAGPDLRSRLRSPTLERSGRSSRRARRVRSSREIEPRASSWRRGGGSSSRRTTSRS